MCPSPCQTGWQLKPRTCLKKYKMKELKPGTYLNKYEMKAQVPIIYIL